MSLCVRSTRIRVRLNISHLWWKQICLQILSLLVVLLGRLIERFLCQLLLKLKEFKCAFIKPFGRKFFNIRISKCLLLFLLPSILFDLFVTLINPLFFLALLLYAIFFLLEYIFPISNALSDRLSQPILWLALTVLSSYLLVTIGLGRRLFILRVLLRSIILLVGVHNELAFLGLRSLHWILVFWLLLDLF